MSMRGLYGTANNVSCEKVELDVSCAFGRHRIAHALIIPKLDLPRQTLSPELARRIEEQERIKLPGFIDKPMYILIGQDNWPLIMSIEARRLGTDGLVVSRTVLGWSVHGYVTDGKRMDISLQAHATCRSKSEEKDDEQQRLAELEKLVRENVENENFGTLTAGTRANKHERALAILEATSRKLDKGWETGLIWKSGLMPELDSKKTALNRLYSLEKKLDRNPEFAARYYREMNRLFENGYTVKVSKDVRRPREWYVPHFGVENVNKPDKVRLVFDAAAKTRGTSLNDLLETGPDLLESLLAVLLRFRQFPVAVKADIKDMFLRVKMLERDRGAQRFLWRGADRDREPDICENTSLIFGSKSSPCSAIYIKNRNAERFSATMPESARSIVKHTYMDDYLASGKTVEEMEKRVREVSAINSEAEFYMHGWASNEKRVVASVLQENKLDEKAIASLCDEIERVLGLYWNPNEDTLGFNVGLSKIRADLLQGKVKPTKREFFQIVMSVFDPLGILAPFTVQAKIIMQDIWVSRIKWDTQIGDAEFTNWLVWVRNLLEIQKCVIPRCYLLGEFEYSIVQLHVFCDASIRAYAAVPYLRTETHRGVKLSIVMAKTRAAPMKPSTIPRLELRATLLGTETATGIEKELEIKVDERVFWSDSTTVLHWINSDAREKQMFVANRLGQIGEASKPEEWRWVPTIENPADDATRLSDKPMRSKDRWFTGPKFLLEKSTFWPKTKALDPATRREKNEMEARKEFIGTFRADTPDNWNGLEAAHRALGWTKLRDMAMDVRKYFYIWHDNVCNKSAAWKKRTRAIRIKIINKKIKRKIVIPPHRKPESETDRLVESEKVWYRVVQSSCFLHEMNLIRKSKELPPGSKLITLDPFIDGEGLLRARGRVLKVTDEKGKEVDTEINPIILDANHFATQLLIGDFHKRYDHANNQTVINELCQQFYIVGLRTRLRWLAQQCVTCRKRRGQPTNPQMAPLPACRLAFRRKAFTHCGIDYFGPMEIKVGRRREKRWGVLFTCMTTRAVHIELASTLNADSAILAIHRMSRRRGSSKHIYSDNGTNFVKASKDLKDAIEVMTKKDKNQVRKLQRYARGKRFEWHFNPPYASNMGGAWERMIRSVKTALYHALDYALNVPEETRPAPTEEVLYTLLVEIEHMANSRPLTHVSTDPRDEEALTPNHILLGCSSGDLPFDKYDVEISNPRKAHEMSQHLANRFWKRWLRDYLPTLLPRTKWQKQTEPLRVNDIVLLVDYQAPRNMWRVGKVAEVFPNKTDKIVRVVKVRVGAKEFIRPVNKLVKIFGGSS